MSFRSELARVVVIAACCSALPAAADDWPQWRGPQRDGVWRETGIVARLPERLERRWSVPCALGYAGPAVADGRVYLFEYEKTGGELTNNPGGRDRLQGIERLRALDAATGDELWRRDNPTEYFVSYASGPRATPTIDGDRVYTFGAEGRLECVRADDGAPVWSVVLAEQFGAETPQWGHSAAPLVQGDLVYAMVGGDGALVVAFDKLTGEEKWRALSAGEPGYCPPTIDGPGGGALCVFQPEAVCDLDPATGGVLWSVPIQSSYGMSIAQPVPVGAERLFVTGYGGVSALLARKPGAKPEVIWSGTPKTSMSCANSTPLVIGETIYGCHADDSALVAVDAATGERLWSSKAPTIGEGARGRHGTAFLVRQGDTDRVWLASETGDLVLARLTPERYEELGRAPLVAPTGETFGRKVWWSHPAFADRAVFARNDEELVRVDLAE